MDYFNLQHSFGTPALSKWSLTGPNERQLTTLQLTHFAYLQNESRFVVKSIETMDQL